MGFGYGARSDRGTKRYNNSQVAHVWAQGDETKSGQSNNGNFYFEGRNLFSYGSHFLVGRIMADGVALLNADSYSVSTSGHQSDASRAISHRDHFYIPRLTDFATILARLDRKSEFSAEGRKHLKADARKLLLERASDLTRRRNAYRYESASDHDDRDESGAYIARLAGIPLAQWESIKRQRAKLDAAEERKRQRREHKDSIARAIHYADMSDSEWRQFMAKDQSKYQSFYDGEAKALYHAIKTAKAEKFSAKRRAILKERRADALRRKNGYESINASYYRWTMIRRAIAGVRAAVGVLAAESPYPIPTRESAVASLAAKFAELSNCSAFPEATRQRLRDQSEALQTIRDNMAEELRQYCEAEAARRDAERAEAARLATLKREEQIAAWHKGAPVRIHFDAESGGAAIRIVGDQLETSHGATVPLAHAVKAFRFVKLVRQRGVAWERNGKTIRVGHFQIDRIDAEGNFTAGCHKFTWPEIERAAILAGVAEESADDSAVEPSGR